MSLTASAADEVSGFSTRTCLPAASAALTSSKCVAAGVAIATAVTAGSSSTSSKLGVARTVVWSPSTARARATSRSQSHLSRIPAVATAVLTRLGPQ